MSVKQISAGIVALALTATVVSAQCKVESSSNEGKLLAFYTVPIVFSAATAPEVLPPGAVRFGFEGEYIPKPSAAIQRSGKCFTSKTEHTSLSPVFGRPRVTIGLPGSLAIEASYLPPVKIADAKPNLASVALSHAHHFDGAGIPGGVTVMLRGNATFGNVKGPITCPRSSLQTTNPNSPCYGTTPSNDTFHPDMFGVDVLAGVRAPNSPLAIYGGIGMNRIDPHFQVGFTDGTGSVDNTKVQLNSPLTRIALTLGATARTSSRIDFGAQLYSVPQDATTIRVHAGITFR